MLSVRRLLAEECPKVHHTSCKMRERVQTCYNRSEPLLDDSPLGCDLRLLDVQDFCTLLPIQSRGEGVLCATPALSDGRDGQRLRREWFSFATSSDGEVGPPQTVYSCQRLRRIKQHQNDLRS